MLDAIVVGAESRVGIALGGHLSKLDISVTTRRRSPRWLEDRLIYLDLSAPTHLPPARITYLIAAITGFKACEEDRGTAEEINVHGTLAVARRQIRNGGNAVFMSSSAVEHKQLSVYALLKLQVEEALASYPENAAIVRCGPIVKDGRATYPDGEYYPIRLLPVIEHLAGLLNDWQPGLHRLTNAARV